MDEARQIRDGEGLDIDALGSYLRSKLDTSEGALAVEQFPAGSSNLTYLVRVGDAEYVLRRPPFGNAVKTAHDMSREFNVLSKLAAVYAPAPKPHLFCSDAAVIGSEFYLMERRKGLIIRGQIEQARASARAICDLNNSQHFRLTVCNNFIKNLADLHSLDYNAAGLGDLGRPDGYNRRQVEGWTKRYFAAKTDEWPELESTIVWLGRNIPAEWGASLIHNDYKFDNVMLDPADLTKITAVLDWEMVTVGDPLMDLGTTLGYWMSPNAGDDMLNMPFNPRILMENITRSELVEMYAKSLGCVLPDMLFYYVFGTFKIAVICQQIYARYVKGFTRDARFAGFDKFVATLGRIASRAIVKQSIG